MLRLDFNPDVVSAAIIESFSENFTRLFEFFSLHPHDEIANFKFVADSNFKLNGPVVPEDLLPDCLLAIYDRSVEFEKQIAIICGETRLTYKQLMNLVASVSAQLQQRCPNAKFIGIYLERGINVVVAILATLHNNAAFVPINKSFPEQKVKNILAI